jgi:hypothetical protein
VLFNAGQEVGDLHGGVALATMMRVVGFRHGPCTGQSEPQLQFSQDCVAVRP